MSGRRKDGRRSHKWVLLTTRLCTEQKMCNDVPHPEEKCSCTNLSSSLNGKLCGSTFASMYNSTVKYLDGWIQCNCCWDIHTEELTCSFQTSTFWRLAGATTIQDLMNITKQKLINRQTKIFFFFHWKGVNFEQVSCKINDHQEISPVILHNLRSSASFCLCTYVYPIAFGSKWWENTVLDWHAWFANFFLRSLYFLQHRVALD